MEPHIPSDVESKAMQFTEALSIYKTYLKLNTRTPTSRKRYSPSTVHKYIEACGYFGEYLRAEHSVVWADISQLRPRQLLAHQDYLAKKLSCYSGQPLREKSICFRMAGVKAMCQYLYIMEIVKTDPTSGIVIPMPDPPGARPVSTFRNWPVGMAR